MKSAQKTPKQLERHFKGMANHWRISLLLAIAKNEKLTVEGLADLLQGNIKTISQHTRSLVHSGLLNKTYVGRTVTHALSPYGKRIVTFIQNF
jgi:DNA-binding MarR family transcriptional regulator